MFTAKPDGSDIRIVDGYGKMSHFIWRDPDAHPGLVMASVTGRCLLPVHRRWRRTAEVVGKGVMTENGHCTYLPGNKWILNDTYPDRDRSSTPTCTTSPPAQASRLATSIPARNMWANVSAIVHRVSARMAGW